MRTSRIRTAALAAVAAALALGLTACGGADAEARMKRDKELTDLEQSKLSGYVWFFVVAAVFW
ncbi:MFS transporter, partial [Streptomyces tubercidicus]